MKSHVLQAVVGLLALVFNKANPNIVNPIKRMWHVSHSSQLLFHSFPKYLKLIKIKPWFKLLVFIEANGV
jgi:hypothetical protein